MSKTSRNGSKGFKSRWFLWETLALVILVGSVAVTAVAPMLDSFFLWLKPDEVLIRMYTEEAGGFTPKTVVLKQGVQVKLVLMSMDVTHRLVIPELGFDSESVHPGYRKVIDFTPAKVGTFEFYCNSTCSPMHPYMRGTLEVIQS